MATYSLMVMPASSARARTTFPSGRAGRVTITSRSPLLGRPPLGLRDMATPNRTYFSDRRQGAGVSAYCRIGMAGEPAGVDRGTRSGTAYQLREPASRLQAAPRFWAGRRPGRAPWWLTGGTR